MIHFGKRAAFADALVVLRGVMAYDLRLFHLNAELLPYKVNGSKDGEEGIPLAAAWTSDLTDRLKRFCRHFVHKYKDSREHFEMRTHKRLIDIVDPTPKAVDSLMHIDLPADVNIEIKL